MAFYYGKDVQVPTRVTWYDSKSLRYSGSRKCT